MTASASSVGRRGLMLVMSSPSGAGKTTMVNLLMRFLGKLNGHYAIERNYGST